MLYDTYNTPEESEDFLQMRHQRRRKRIADLQRDRLRKAKRLRKKGRPQGELPPWLRDDALQRLSDELRHMDLAHLRSSRSDRANRQNSRALKPVPWSVLQPATVIDAWVPFQDGTGYKRRPAAVIDAGKSFGVRVCPITTSRRRFFRQGQLIELFHWRKSGLQRPCGVQRREVHLERSDVLGVFGSLHLEDADQFEVWKHHFDGVAAAHRVAAASLIAQAA